MRSRTSPAPPVLSLTWETVLKIVIGIIIPLLPIGLAIYQYSSQTSRNLRQQFRQELWLQKKNNYSEICGVLGSIATGKETDTEYHADLKTFFSIYYGKTRLFNDKAINDYLGNIAETLLNKFNYANRDELNILRQQVIHLGDLCRNSLIADLEN